MKSSIVAGRVSLSTILRAERAGLRLGPSAAVNAGRFVTVGVGVGEALGARSASSCGGEADIARTASYARAGGEILASTARSTGGFGLVADQGVLAGCAG